MPQPGFKELPPLHALAAFEAVARLQSFARAADELCVTHSAVSHRIAALERHVGARLLTRRTGRVALTTKGTYFLTAVLDALSILQEASTRVAEKRQTITISAGPTAAYNWLVGRLGDFYRAHPETDLDIGVTKLTQQAKRKSLETGQADVAIRYGRAEDWSGLVSVRLMEVTLFPVCSPRYRISAGGLRHLEDLRKSVLLRLPHEPWQPWFQAAGLAWPEPASGPLFGDASLMLDAAANGQGVALVRSVLVADALVSGRLVRLFDIAIPSSKAYYAVSTPAAARRSEVRAFIAWLVAASHAPARPEPSLRPQRRAAKTVSRQAM